MRFILILEKYSFMFILCFIMGLYTPNLTSKLNLMELDFSQQSGSNSLKQIFWLFLFLFFVVRTFAANNFERYKKAMVIAMSTVMPILLVGLLSLIWSEEFFYTLKRIIFQFMFCITVISSFYFAIKHKTIVTCCVITAIIIIVLCFTSILLGTGFNGLGLSGYAKSKNVLASHILTIMIVLTVLNNVLKFKVPYLNKLYILLGFLLVLTISKTSILMMLLFYCIIIYLPFIGRYLSSVLFISAFSIFIFIPSLSYHLEGPWNIAMWLDNDAITGRGEIWDTIYHDILFYNKDLLGYGFAAYFGVSSLIPYFLDIEYSFLQLITSTHNGYINLYLQFGIFGSILIFLTLFRFGKNNTNYILQAMLLIPLIHNITESSFFVDQSLIWLLFIISVTTDALLRSDREI